MAGADFVVINRDLNKHDPAGRINFLRRYRFNKPSALQRLFMLYSPPGDLDRLRTRYAIWDEYL